MSKSLSNSLPKGATKIVLTNYRIKPPKKSGEKNYVVFDVYFLTHTSNGIFAIWLLNCFSYRNRKGFVVWNPPISRGSSAFSMSCVKVNLLLYNEIQAEIEAKFGKVLVKKEWKPRKSLGERFASADDAIAKFLLENPDMKLLEAGEEKLIEDGKNE